MKPIMYLASVALFATPLAAQDAVPEAPLQPLDVAEVAPAELQGVDVLGKDGDEIGRITAIVFTSTGEMDAAVVSTGGFLGFGRHSVAIPLTELNLSTEADSPGSVIVQLPMTQDDLKEMPEVGETPIAQ